MTEEVLRDPGEYRFVIAGACPPKGSKVPVRKGSSAMREASTRVAPWTEDAIRQMRDHLGNPLARFKGPVYVAPVFYFRRPKVTEFPFPTAITIGDVDKLVRCLLDAMTKAGVFEDDRFVVDLIRPRKRWGDDDRTVAEVGCARLRAVNPYAEPEGDSCPRCQSALISGPGGGVECREPTCGYWFCY